MEFYRIKEIRIEKLLDIGKQNKKLLKMHA